MYRPERIKNLRDLLHAAKIEALYVSGPENRYYLSGFTGSAGNLLVCREQTVLFTDSRYIEQAKLENPELKLIEVRNSYGEALAAFLRENRIARLGIDGEHLKYNQYLSFKKKLPNVDIKEAGGLVEDLRMIKDKEEISRMTKAAWLAEQAFARVLSMVRPGVTERQVALRLEYIMKDMGAEDTAFKTIVASGARGALPHGVASDKQLEKQEMVTMDFGAVYRGYHSDITRTVLLGEPNVKQQEIYSIVMEAQTKALKSMRSGVRAAEVDRVARDIITCKGYGNFFGHGTGHGLGLHIHENPRLSQKDDTVLQCGMTVTVEPGIYLPNWGGVRIEDTVVVEKHGCRVLTGSPELTLRNILVES